MQLQNSTPRGSLERARIARFALLAALLAAVAAPARADSNFEKGFENQLGRILAFEAVQAGKALLFSGVAVAPAYYAPPVAYAAPAAVPVPVPVAVPVPYWQPAYAVAVPRPVYYRRAHYGHGHGRGHHRRGHDCN